MLFIGWTANTTGDKIYTASDTAPTTVATVDINGDTTVYAAWGVDTNGDGVPDVNETGKYTLTYAENELESGTLQGVLPTDSGTYVKGNTVAWPTEAASASPELQPATRERPVSWAGPRHRLTAFSRRVTPCPPVLWGR